METGHRPPPGVAPRPCPALAAPALLFYVSAGRCGAAGGTGVRCSLRPPRHRVRCVVDPGAGIPQHRPERTQEKAPSCFGFRAEASAPDSRAPAPALTDVSILIVVLFQLHVQQNVPTHHLHVSPIPALGSARRCSAPLGSGRKLRSAL